MSFTISAMHATAAVWGVMIGALLGQFANRIIAAYHRAFMPDALQAAFLVGLVAALGFHAYTAVAFGFTVVGFVVGVVMDTIILGVVMTASRLVYNIMEDAVKNVWSIGKAWVQSLWGEAKGAVTGEYEDVKGNHARATVGVVRP